LSLATSKKLSNALQEAGRDRRRCRRFPVPGDVFLTFRPGFEKIGYVKDVSKTGISFEYMAFENADMVEEGNAGYVEVDIFSRAQNFHIYRIPCEIVYDMEHRASLFLHAAQTRRCGLKFLQVSQELASQLSVFSGKYC
jgi:hypothetical protein